MGEHWCLCTRDNLSWQKTGQAICSAAHPHIHTTTFLIQCKLTPRRSARHASLGWSCFWIRSEDWCPVSVWGRRAASLWRTRPASASRSPLPAGHKHKSRNVTLGRNHTMFIFRRCNTHFGQFLKNLLPLLLRHDGAVQVDLWPRVFISLLQRPWSQKTCGCEKRFNLLCLVLPLTDGPQAAASSLLENQTT